MQTETNQTETSDEVSEPTVNAAKWAQTAEPGDYLRTYEDAGGSDVSDPGSRCGYDDQQLDEANRILAERNLTMQADDTGLVAVEIESA